MLYGEKMKQILEKFGVDTSTLPDNLYSTLLDAIYNVEVAQNMEWVENISGTIGINKGEIEIRTIMKDIVLPQGITSIGNSAFSGCSSLESITIPDSVTNIGQGAFINCTKLESITIPNSVTSIGDTYSAPNGTFLDCTSLTSITIPNSITLLGFECFRGCNNLAHIYYTGTEEQWNAITKCSSWNYQMGSNVSGGTVIHYNYVPE